MKVLIDGFFLPKPRGMGRYAQELLFALGRYSPSDLAITVVVPEGMPHSAWICPDRIDYVSARRTPFPVWEQLVMPRQVANIRPDVVHFPYNTSAIYSARAVARVVTIHDLMYMEDGHETSGTTYQSLGNLYRKLVVRGYPRRVQSIVTDSTRSAEQIQQRLGLTSQVVYIPTEYAFGKYAGQTPSGTSASADRYFLHVGGVSPHKNTERCIKAFLNLQASDLKLIVTGLPKDSQLAQTFRSAQVVFPGWISDEALSDLYFNAAAVVFPSLVEGYGLPIIEAFTVGVPVITSALPPMNELAGDAALLVDPRSEQSMSDAMRAVLDPTLAAAIIAKGRQRLQVINGVNMAAQMLDVYAGALR